MGLLIFKSRHLDVTILISRIIWGLTTVFITEGGVHKYDF